ncbi:hypothetical protein A33M_1854 [Rhodovulum sp. PH10]|nr:hypothetical protein A33M_1854 [Rhodovulum sp. PH10]
MSRFTFAGLERFVSRYTDDRAGPSNRPRRFFFARDLSPDAGEGMHTSPRMQMSVMRGLRPAHPSTSRCLVSSGALDRRIAAFARPLGPARRSRRPMFLDTTTRNLTWPCSLPSLTDGRAGSGRQHSARLFRKGYTSTVVPYWVFMV